jgi:hypothetical protein
MGGPVRQLALLNPTAVLLAPLGIVACTLLDGPPAPVFVDPFALQGIVAGFVRDSAGRGVPNVTVCAVAGFTASGTPVIVSRTASAKRNGAYLIQVDLTLHPPVDVRASLGLTANPLSGSGLAPLTEGRRSVLLSTTIPPPETTYVDLVLAAGTPVEGVYCVAGL